MEQIEIIFEKHLISCHFICTDVTFRLREFKYHFETHLKIFSFSQTNCFIAPVVFVGMRQTPPTFKTVRLMNIAPIKLEYSGRLFLINMGVSPPISARPPRLLVILMK